jgi:lipoprotein-anchoring transpeptidase ErfK/SrfK
MKALAQRVRLSASPVRRRVAGRLRLVTWQRVEPTARSLARRVAERLGPLPPPAARRFGLARLQGWQRVAIVAALAMLLAGGVAAAATARVAASSGRVLNGVRVDGVDLGGMNRVQATRALSEHADQALHRAITVCAMIAGHCHQQRLTPATLGVTVTVAPAVEAALVGPRMSWLSRTWHRVTGQAVRQPVPLAFQSDPRRIAAYVQRLAGKLDVPPVDAGIVLVGDHVVAHHARAGWVIDRAAAVSALTAAVGGSGVQSVQLKVTHALPKVTDQHLGKTVDVDLSSNRLTLWSGFKRMRTYPVATAKPGFSTPRGSWKVVDKQVNPTWHNPAPHGWGAGEPLVIPGGPHSPLGTRALFLNAPGIRIHGTPADSSIGSYASHGCIRMHMHDVEALYPLVPVGTPVLVHGARR